MWAMDAGERVGLLDALAAPLSVDPVRLSESELQAALAEVLVGVDRLNARAARLLAEAGDRGLTAPDGRGAPRPATYLRELATAAIGRSEANRVARRAQARAVLPAVTALHETGAVSTAFLDAAATGVRGLDDEVVASLDEVLAGDARVIEPHRVGAVIEQARAMTDTDDANQAADEREQRSKVYLSPVGSDGSWALNGTLYGPEAERLALMLDTYGRQAAGWRKPGPEDRALGLFQIARIAERALDDPEYKNPSRGHDTHLIVLATAAAWAGEPGAPAPTTAEELTLDPGYLEARKCSSVPDVLISDGLRLATSGTIDWPTDEELLQAQLAGLARVGGGYRLEPLAYGRAKRRATQAIYDALIARDHGCVMPWCERGPTWTDVHHLLEVAADDGPTDIEALALVCFPDHNRMHRTGQHLHPPWCVCPDCAHDPRKRWQLRRETPVIDANPRVLRSEPFGRAGFITPAVAAAVPAP